MIIMGIDLGSLNMGWAVVEETRRPFRIQYIDSNTISVPSKYKIFQRLSMIEKELLKLFKMFNPDEIAFEKGFTSAAYINKSNQYKPSTFVSSEKVAYSRGVVGKCAAGFLNKEPYEVPINTMKKVITGDGTADKEQVRTCIEFRLKHKFDGKLDESDAAAISYAAAVHFQIGEYKQEKFTKEMKG